MARTRGTRHAKVRAMQARRILVGVGLSAVMAVSFACSGGTATVGGDGGGGDGGCIDPVEGSNCSTSDVACQPPGDICCVGYSWMCFNGQWKKMGVGCACQVEAGLPEGGPFACGGTTCDSPGQVCVDQAPGIALPDGGVPPDSYSCGSLPAACAGDPTCACVSAHDPCSTQLSGCDESGGAITVHCMGQ
jgi:hypothetical protein